MLLNVTSYSKAFEMDKAFLSAYVEGGEIGVSAYGMGGVCRGDMWREGIWAYVGEGGQGVGWGRCIGVYRRTQRGGYLGRVEGGTSAYRRLGRGRGEDQIGVPVHRRKSLVACTLALGLGCRGWAVPAYTNYQSLIGKMVPPAIIPMKDR